MKEKDAIVAIRDSFNSRQKGNRNQRRKHEEEGTQGVSRREQGCMQKIKIRPAVSKTLLLGSGEVLRERRKKEGGAVVEGEGQEDP